MDHFKQVYASFLEVNEENKEEEINIEEEQSMAPILYNVPFRVTKNDISNVEIAEQYEVPLA